MARAPHKTSAVVGILEDDANPMVNVMKLDKAPKESYADIGGLDQQIQEIKVGTKKGGERASEQGRA